MTNRKRIIPASLALLITLVAVACGTIPPAATPTPENTPLTAVTSTPENTPAPTPTPEAEFTGVDPPVRSNGDGVCAGGCVYDGE